MAHSILLIILSIPAQRMGVLKGSATFSEGNVT